MPLPIPNAEWPPEPFNKIQHTLNEWSAWYAGDPQELVSVYSSGLSNVASRYQFYGGLVGWVARLFWGAPASKGAANTSKLHVPLAEDIALEGAKQLFKNPPTLTTASTTHQDQIERFIENGLFTQLLETAELSCALGDSYVRVGYDLDISDLPLNSVHPGDLVIPSFYYNRLQDVVIWRELLRDGGRVYRHIEYHEPGYIYHRLYEGTSDNVGKVIPLTTFTETATLRESVSTGLDELDVIRFPNLRTRLWRKLGQASNLGRSDFGAPGTITLMDALDETYTSLMRDIRLGKYRLMVSQGALDNLGRGEGAGFDLDKEVFVELNVLGDATKLDIVPAQAAIRVTDHTNAALALTKAVISSSGYSEQTFGLTGEVAMTATESNNRERKTFATRDIKIQGTYTPRTSDLVRVMQKTMVVMGKGTIPPDDLLVEFPLPVEDDAKEVAETIKILSEASAISPYEKVKLRKPDWDENRIKAEVNAINGSVLPS